MKSRVRRIYAEKKEKYDSEGKSLCHEFNEYLRLKEVERVRVIHRYDAEGISEEAYDQAKNTVFSEPPVDIVYDEDITFNENEKVFAWEYLPGQYDQRADSAAQAIQILTRGMKPIIKSATIISVEGKISGKDWDRIKNYVINPVDSREASMDKPASLEENYPVPDDIPVINGFISMDEKKLDDLLNDMSLAMDMDDLKFCRDYFRDSQQRDPTLTELRIIDTYWSDHCRHTTFLTEIDSVEFEKGSYTSIFEAVYLKYLESRNKLGFDKKKPVSLMDIATIAMKELKKNGKIPDLDESEEINACSIVVPVEIGGKIEDWLVQFKNETHNHPTEIEPFGGAATCIGGAIRDPLSGRAFVYQAMRVTGSGDPRTEIENTMTGKLPQRKITVGAANGYSSYGNQIGLSTGFVAEIYDEGYIAKRMEIGAVIGAAPKSSVIRLKPVPGDSVLLIGGRTGRDGCGGATGSSKIHTEDSVLKSGAEVQKGNAPEERKLQRLFRNPNAAKLIKKCNDFGAGGVSVAIGELADGLSVDLDRIPRKYEGLDGTELAISESQERMAVVVDGKDTAKFMEFASKENLEATLVAEVTKEPVFGMKWRGKEIVRLDREFLNSNGAEKHINIKVMNPIAEKCPFEDINPRLKDCGTYEAWLINLADLNVASQKGLVERFDSNIGAASVLMPFGGQYRLTPSEFMAAKIPLLKGETATSTVMAYGFDPRISRWSPFHGAVYAVVESISKILAAGADPSKIRLTLQEYFEKPGRDPERWGKPFTALLGAYYAQLALSVPSIGGKDSMSGSFNEIDVPPTLVSFAVNTMDAGQTITPEFKKAGSRVIYIPVERDDLHLPVWEKLLKTCKKIFGLMHSGKVLSSHTVGGYGIADAIGKMCFGNKIGFEFAYEPPKQELFGPGYGSMILELCDCEEPSELEGIDYKNLGNTIREKLIKIGESTLDIEKLISVWLEPLSGIFPYEKNTEDEKFGADYLYENNKEILIRKSSVAKPGVIITVFPGTNSEYDSARAFEKAGALTDVFVFRNRTPSDVTDSLSEMVRLINKNNIIMIPGGFSAGDEPEGSGKFIAAVFRNSAVRDSVMDLLEKRDGLILGICNGFQALIKLGLVPWGEIRDMDPNSPTLTYNTIGRHVASMIRTKVVSRLSPWFSTSELGEIHTVPVSHGEGRFICPEGTIGLLMKNGQIATQYVDENGKPAVKMPYNPNGSYFAVEGITSPDGRVLGKMAHSERVSEYVARNIPGNKFQRIFEAGVKYFK